MDAQKGFTLVEIAVVMIIIGLLLGGILKGQAMIESARLNATIRQVNGINAAINTFQDKYSAKPGDMMSASSRIIGCASPNCADGDGNGVIGSDGVTNEGGWQSNILEYRFASETIQFWRHLAISEIISGIDTEADLANPRYGITHLSSPFGGGYEMYFDTNMVIGAGNQRTSMHVMRLNGSITGGVNGVINTVLAQAIDTKMDDGDPNGGLVFADYGGINTPCKNRLIGRVSVYDTGNPENMCIMFFKMFSR